MSKITECKEIERKILELRDEEYELEEKIKQIKARRFKLRQICPHINRTYTNSLYYTGTCLTCGKEFYENN